MKSLIKLIIGCQILSTTYTTFATKYSIDSNSNIVGEIKKINVPGGYDLFRIGHKYDIGFHEITEANPKINPWSPNGKKIILPSEYILPPHNKSIDNIVINLPELRLYYFPKNSNHVYTYPIGIGQESFPTPKSISTKITQKRENPIWTVPPSVLKKWEEEGHKIVKTVPAGPGNPLGDYAMNLTIPSYLIHGTNDPIGVGLRISHGCVRMYPEDIKALFNMVSVGTKVDFMNNIYKIGVNNNKLYLEAHVPLKEDKGAISNEIASIKERLQKAPYDQFNIDWNEFNNIVNTSQGIPFEIGTKG